MKFAQIIIGSLGRSSNIASDTGMASVGNLYNLLDEGERKKPKKNKKKKAKGTIADEAGKRQGSPEHLDPYIESRFCGRAPRVV